MAGGISTFDAMLPYITNQLPEYENDPVVVSAMREACHHDLYAIANSVAMNGVGENTLVKAVELKLVRIVRIVMIVFILLFVVSLYSLSRRKRNLKRVRLTLTFRKQRKRASKNKYNPIK